MVLRHFRIWRRDQGPGLPEPLSKKAFTGVQVRLVSRAPYLRDRSPVMSRAMEPKLLPIGIAAAALCGAALLVPLGSRAGSVETASLTAGRPVLTIAPPAEADPEVPNPQLQDGLTALRKGQIGLALSVRDQLPKHSMDWEILTWAVALHGNHVPSSEIAAAAAALPDWPGALTLRKNSERALFAENPPAQAVVDAFGNTEPLTFEGRVLLTRALLALGKAEAAHGVIAPFWRVEKLDGRQEALILKEFGSALTQADHRVRMERMLYEDRLASAKRVARAAGAAELCAAWSAVVQGARTAPKLLDAVPKEQRAAGYLFAKARWLRRTGKIEDAAKAMLAAPKSGAELIDPDEWWTERRALSRELVDSGDMQTAYRIAADHAAESPVEAADAEFHAGWYALRGLHDPKTAARHFARIAEIRNTPIMQARASYWLGRAADAGSGGNARSFYSRAAQYGTTFYGQLAAAKLGLSALALNAPVPSAADQAAFAQRDSVKAIARLESAGFPSLANALYRDLADDLSSPGELALLAAMAEKRGNHYLALKIGKAAAGRGMDVGALTHPIGAIPDTADIPSAGKALAYAVARQESEFNMGAVSSAGARGMLQLLPGTAKEAARMAGLPYSWQRLTSDPGYNATLGAAFLNDQLSRFDGSYVLTFAGYNAGPRKAREWVERYGDPRGRDIDTVVDWIERIPYAETRAYVQRVMENYQVYKMRISGGCNIAADLVRGR